MEAIPKGPTGKPKRIGLAEMLGIPIVPQGNTTDDIFTVAGTEGLYLTWVGGWVDGWMRESG